MDLLHLDQILNPLRQHVYTRLRRRHRHQTPDIRLHTAYASAKTNGHLEVADGCCCPDVLYRC